MADETVGQFQVIPPGPPTSEQVGQAFNATQAQIQAQTSEAITAALNDLVAGKNPIKSKSLQFNVPLILIGIAGTVYQAWAAGDIQSIAPFLAMFGTGAVNTILRFVTNGPILTNGLQGIIDAYANLTGPPKLQL
jgi:hypothetical protein